MQEDVLKRLVSSLKCGSCGHSYREAGIDVLERDRDIWFLKVLCPACHVRCLVAAIIREGQPASDLTAAEAEKFRGAAAVGAEDLLEMHAFLKAYHGDVAGLLG